MLRSLPFRVLPRIEDKVPILRVQLGHLFFVLGIPAGLSQHDQNADRIEKQFPGDGLPFLPNRPASLGWANAVPRFLEPITSATGRGRG